LASNAAKSIAKSQAKEQAKDQVAKQKGAPSSTSKVKAAEAAPMPSLNVKALAPKPVQK
jgi:hypothetical protein